MEDQLGKFTNLWILICYSTKQVRTLWVHGDARKGAADCKSAPMILNYECTTKGLNQQRFGMISSRPILTCFNIHSPALLKHHQPPAIMADRSPMV